METGILHFHSGVRYIVLLLLVISVVSAYIGMSGGKEYTKGILRLHLVTRILLIVEGLIGIGLYFLRGYQMQFANMGNLPDQVNFFLLRHPIAMLLAIILCSVGYARAMKAENSGEKFKRIAIFYTIGLLLILSSIPFPFIQSWAKWL